MPSWPTMMPPDLRRVLDGTLSSRGVSSAEVWTDLRDWLIKHQVEPPAELPEDRERGRAE
jgi:hypothetical protein